MVLNMKFELNTLLNETDYILTSIKKYFKVMLPEELHINGEIEEGAGADAIFEEFKVKLPKLKRGVNNIMDASMYTEASIVKVFKEIGYEYKKPMGPKLHFFNKQTSISVYLNQKTKHITLVP